MTQPPDFEAFLDTLLAESQADAEAVAHAKRFVSQFTGDSQAMIATEDAHGKVRYFVLNLDRPSALTLMARFGAGLAEAIASEPNEA